MGLTTAGASQISAIIDASGTAYGPTTAYMQPGTSVTQFTIADTTITGAGNRELVSSTPTATTGVMVHVATWDATEALIAWEELGLWNAAAGGQLLIRSADVATGLPFTPSPKGAETWVVTLTSTLSVDQTGVGGVTTAGKNAIADRIVANGVSAAFDATTGYLGVGNSATAWSAAQTDLIGTAVRALVSATPTHPASTTTVWTTTFGSAVANFVWNEQGVFNAAAAGTMLLRHVIALNGGVAKTSGEVWSLSLTTVFTSQSANGT